MNAPAFCIRTTCDLLRRLCLFLCPPRSPPPPRRRLRRSVDDISGEDIVVAKPEEEEDEDVNDDESTLLAFSSSARKLRRPPKPSLERPDDIVEGLLRIARIVVPRRARDFVLVRRFVFPIPFPTRRHNSTRGVRSTTKKTDGRKKKRELNFLFVPPSLFLVAFEDDFDKDGTRVLTRYVRV